MLTDKQLHILRHTLGIDARKPPQPYRNHLCANAGEPAMHELVRLGMMELVPMVIWSGETFRCTDAGRDAAIASAEERHRANLGTRSQQRFRRFCDLRDAVPRLTFREFLRHEKEFPQ